MFSSFTAQDILDDIEFELMQGAISHDDLGRGVAAIKQYQAKLRAELLQPGQPAPDLREALGRQFQLNDMLLTLLQETAVALQTTNQQWEKAARRHPLAPPPTANATLTTEWDPSIWRDSHSLQETAVASLDVKPDLQMATTPIIGPFLQRLRHAAHMLVIFYVNKLAQRQKQVNHTLADWLLYQDGLNHYQAEEYAHLQRQLVEMQQRLAALENRDG
ncbi:MAG: hypothetical protein IPM39_13910 [Chloroflexi bacterium]|nr:hypothetical protein [Chloroflexota bacterium]